MTFGLTCDDLVQCYRRGVFPMADDRDDEGIFLIDPPLRGVLPLEDFHLSRRLARTVRQSRFQLVVDENFGAVVAACATSGLRRKATWINHGIEALYGELHQRGLAHSVECRLGTELVGGLYGVALGAAFFGESMFSTERDASKIAMVHLVARLRIGGFKLLDTQFITEHLRQFGAIEVPRRTYRQRLLTAIDTPADFYRFTGTGSDVVQVINQTS